MVIAAFALLYSFKSIYEAYFIVSDKYTELKKYSHWQQRLSHDKIFSHYHRHQTLLTKYFFLNFTLSFEI